MSQGSEVIMSTNRPQDLTSEAIDIDAFQGLPTPRRQWAAATLLTAISLAVMDAMIANVALPTIATELNASSASAVWVINAYNLTLVVLLLPFSAMAERIGFRRMFGFGLILFTLASLGCALAYSLNTLIGARIFQGVGASCLMSLVGGLTRNIYPLDKLGRGLSWNALTVGVMSVLGPTVGSAILAVATWPWIFAVNVPIGIVAMFGLRYLPDVPCGVASFDGVSALLSMVTLGAFVSGVGYLGESLPYAFSLLSISACAGLLLYRRVRHHPAPLVPIDLLRIRPVAYAVGAATFTLTAQMSAFVALPFYFQEVLHRSYLEVGMLMGAWPLGSVLVAPIAGRFSDRYSPALLGGGGALGMVAGLSWVAALPQSSSNLLIMIGMLVAGLSFGFFQAANGRAILSNSPRIRSGAAGGLQAVTRVFGQSLGGALVAIAFSVAGTDGPMTGVAMAVICAALAIVVNLVRFIKARSVG